MLETAALSAVRSQSARRAAILPVSIILHAVAGAAALLSSIWVIDFPHSPPNQFSLMPVRVDTTIPEPLGTPRREPAPPQPRSEPAPDPAAPVAPTEIPEDIPVLTSNEMPSSAMELPGSGAGDSADTGPVGVPWGVDGGIPNGGGGVPGEQQAPLQVGGDVKAPVVIHRVEPNYPGLLIRMRKEGIVVVECVIDRTGRIRQVRALRSPHPLLETAATDAVRQWQFSPGTLNGKPVDVVFVLTVNFELN